MTFCKAVLIAALACLFSIPANASPVLNNLQQVGTSQLYDVSGDATISCADGSVRTVSSNQPVPCGDGSVRQIGGSDPLSCTQNNLKQLGLALHNGINSDVVCSDGSVRTIPGSNSNFFLLPFLEGATLCFDQPTIRNKITDGTSNTLLFGESVGLGVTPGFLSQRVPIRTFSDGTSNTIFFGELPASGFCFGNTTIGAPVVGDVGNGGSVFPGGGFDVCFKSARFGFVDGTSNTILFGETENNVCLQGARIGPELTAAVVAEPASFALFLPATLLLLRRGRRRTQFC